VTLEISEINSVADGHVKYFNSWIMVISVILISSIVYVCRHTFLIKCRNSYYLTGYEHRYIPDELKFINGNSKSAKIP